MRSHFFIVLWFGLWAGGVVLAGDHSAAYWISRGDSAYHSFEHQAALRFYQRALANDSLNYEAAWKTARALVDLGEGLRDKAQRKKNYLAARRYAEKAIVMDSTRARGYLFLSIALGRVALDAGAKERVRLSREIKAAVDRALALNPNDDVAWHVLGRWHHKIATLSWLERGFANVFLGRVPKEAAVEQAAACFRRAIALQPQAIAHHLQLALALEELNQKDAAIREFQTVLELPVRDSDDPGYQASAAEHLKKLQ